MIILDDQARQEKQSETFHSPSQPSQLVPAVLRLYSGPAQVVCIGIVVHESELQFCSSCKGFDETDPERILKTV